MKMKLQIQNKLVVNLSPNSIAPLGFELASTFACCMLYYIGDFPVEIVY